MKFHLEDFQADSSLSHCLINLTISQNRFQEAINGMESRRKLTLSSKADEENTFFKETKVNHCLLIFQVKVDFASR